MIKFNQHCGTLDLDAIRHWTAVCTFLVTAGIGRSSECFHDDLVFLRHQIQQGTISLSEFLHDYDLPATANFYQNSPATKIPDLGLWPTLKKGIPGHESEPILKMGTLPLSSSDRGVNKQFLKTLGNQLDKWGNSAEPTFNGRYTFGIELEVKTPSLHTEETSEESLGFCGTKNGLAKQDPDPSDIRHCSHESTFDTRCERFIQVVKKKLGIFFFKPGFGDQYWGMEPWAARKKMFAEKGGIFCTPGFADDWHAWGIVEDASLGSYKNWKGYNSLHGLELVSPILRDKAECWESMLDVVSGLRRTMRLVVDQKCGVHVNVGKGAELMPFHFYRKLSCLMYCADHVIFSLCRPDRRKEDGFSHPLRDSNGVGLVVFFYARWENIPFPKGLSDYIPVDKLSSVDVAILKKIWSAPDKKALEDLLMRWGGRSCLSILRIQNTNVPGYLSGAVEFRHLEGNLDPELIIRFSQLMVALFQFADQAEPEEWCLLVENLMCCQSPRSYDSVVLWRLLVQLGLGKDFGYWVKRAWKNWTLPSASAMKEWVDDDLHGYMNSLKVEQPVPQKHVEFIRQNICRREGRPQYMSQAPKNQTPRTPEAVDVRREIKARAESILKTVSPGEGISRLNPGHAFSKIMKLARPAQGDPSEEEKPTRHSPEAGQDVRTIHLHQILIDSQHQAQSLQDLELSEQELNKFAGLHCREKNGRGLLDAFPRLVGPMLEINATEEDWGTFLGGQ
ncbi:hypothetical protein B0J13DRAFT_536908 [Dactylonectria estremocensis]|uniref:Uncharacterized protein n=1 Tax=Dactylonectria estremocensis TaxID=1079267 RepID=A0A9P9FJ13_9HYPO|nr:hypothetical protein B0J13DRAFT_536908 [Dactylonectria estremocensis]